MSNPHSGSFRHFLTPQEFNAKYAPTAQQEQAVVTALQQQGFTVTHRYANRTIVDASAPSATVERFFATEMHTVNQGKYGTRFTNVKSATVPSNIASLVRTASLTNLVMVRTVADQSSGSAPSKHIEFAAKVPGRSSAGKEAPASRRKLVKTDAACNCCSTPDSNPETSIGRRPTM